MSKKEKPIRCPFCKQVLIKGELKKYETLSDHVLNPNAEDYPLRETYICTCKKSDALFWDGYGDYYITASMINTDLKWGERYDALDSGAYKCTKKLKRENKLRKTLIGRAWLFIERQYELRLYYLKKNIR